MQTKLNRRSTSRCTRNIHCFWSDSVTSVDMTVSRRRLFDSTTKEFIKNSDIPAKPVLTHLPRMQMLYSIRAAAGLEGEGTASSFLPNRKKSASQAGNKKKKKKSFRRGRNLPWRNDLFEDGLKAAGLSELDAGTKLHVSNLDAGLTNEDIRVLFLEIGELIRYGILFDKNGRPSAHSAVVALDYCGKVLGFQLFQGIWVKLAGTDWVLVKRFYYNIKTKVSGVPLSVPSASEEAVNLITLLCSWDPCKRPTAAEALQHPFFKSCFYVPPFLRPKADLAKTPPSAGIKAALVPKPGKSYSGTLLNPKCSNKLNKPLVPPHAGIQRKFGDDSSGGTKIFETGGCCAWEEGEEHLGDSGCSIF